MVINIRLVALLSLSLFILWNIACFHRPRLRHLARYFQHLPWVVLVPVLVKTLHEVVLWDTFFGQIQRKYASYIELLMCNFHHDEQSQPTHLYQYIFLSGIIRPIRAISSTTSFMQSRRASISISGIISIPWNICHNLAYVRLGIESFFHGRLTLPLVVPHGKANLPFWRIFV